MADAYLISKCIYCQEDISGLCVQCCVCEDFVFCLQCFAAGAELGSHKRNHAYKFTDDEWPNIIIVKGEGDWTASEELSLLKSIEVLGFGNWSGLSAILENRSPDEVKEHYMSRYLEGIIGKATWGGIQRPDFRGDNNISEPSTDLSRLPPLDCTLMEVYLLGYMPKRDDFDRESSTDIEAEQLISSLIGITTENEELDTALKLAQVDMYMRRLRERVRRKKIVRDYQLIAKFFLYHRKDGRKSHLTKEQRVFRDRMRVFSQFSSATEHETLISGLEREQELRLRLNELARYRQAGLTHMDECAHYEQHLSYLRRSQPTNTPSNTTTPATNQWKHAKSDSSGYGPSSPADLFEKSARGKTSSSFIDQRYTYHTDVTSTNDLPESQNHSRATSPEMEWSPSLTESIHPHQTVQQQHPNRTNCKMSLRPVPPNELLPENEYKLCKSLNMHPLQYITLKTILLKANLSNSDIDSSSEDEAMDSSTPKQIMWDANCINKVSDYMYANGWIY